MTFLFILAREEREKEFLSAQHQQKVYFTLICMFESLNLRQTHSSVEPFESVWHTWGDGSHHTFSLSAKTHACSLVALTLENPSSSLLTHSSQHQGATMTQTEQEGLSLVQIHAHALTPGHDPTHNESPLKNVFLEGPAFFFLPTLLTALSSSASPGRHNTLQLTLQSCYSLTQWNIWMWKQHLFLGYYLC